MCSQWQYYPDIWISGLVSPFIFIFVHSVGLVFLLFIIHSVFLYFLSSCGCYKLLSIRLYDFTAFFFIFIDRRKIFVWVNYCAGFFFMFYVLEILMFYVLEIFMFYVLEMFLFYVLEIFIVPPSPIYTMKIRCERTFNWRTPDHTNVASVVLTILWPFCYNSVILPNSYPLTP